MTEPLWYVLSDGREFGPLSHPQIVALVSQNALNPQAFVSVDRVNWQILGQVFALQPTPSAYSPVPTAVSSPHIVPLPVPAPPPMPTFGHDGNRPRSKPTKPRNRSKLLLTLSAIGLLGAMGAWCLGILAFPFAALSPVSWWMAARELRAIRQGRLSPKGTGSVQLAVANGLLGTLVFAAWLVIFALAIIAELQGPIHE